MKKRKPDRYIKEVKDEIKGVYDEVIKHRASSILNDLRRLVGPEVFNQIVKEEYNDENRTFKEIK